MTIDDLCPGNEPGAGMPYGSNMLWMLLSDDRSTCAGKVLLTHLMMKHYQYEAGKIILRWGHKKKKVSSRP